MWSVLHHIIIYFSKYLNQVSKSIPKLIQNEVKIRRCKGNYSVKMSLRDDMEVSRTHDESSGSNESITEIEKRNPYGEIGKAKRNERSKREIR